MRRTGNGFGPLIARRSVLKGAGALAFAPLLAGLGAKNACSAQQPTQNNAASISTTLSKYNTSLVLLGTTGGMTWWPQTTRAGNSQVLAVGDAMYVIDLGGGCLARFTEGFNNSDALFATIDGYKAQKQLSHYFKPIRALFFTHLHMDHLGDYPAFLEMGINTGVGKDQKLVVIGPGNRGKLEEKTSDYPDAGTVVQAQSCNPFVSTTTPGTKMMTNHILQAFAQTFNDCTHDEGFPDLPSRLDVREIGDPDTIPWPKSFVLPDPEVTWTPEITCPAMDPFEIFKDDLVRVTATLVNHYQVYPSFAFRFDTADGSLVISGDTGPDTSGNLQKLAKGADVLVHEVLDDLYVKAAFGDDPKNGPEPELYRHMVTAHTSSTKVGNVAEQCGVKTLVLSHIAPGNANTERLYANASQGFSGKVIVGEDLFSIGVGKTKA